MQIHEPVALFSLTYTRNLITYIFPSFKFANCENLGIHGILFSDDQTICVCERYAKVAKAPLQTMENLVSL